MTDHGLAGELLGRQQARPSAARGATDQQTDGRPTTDRQTDGRQTPDRPTADRPRPDRPTDDGGRAFVLSLADVLSRCDRHLQEVGRRNHLFGWLRPPGAGADGWLPVDAYYPRNRLVVLYRPQARTHDQIYRELIPEHGLRLLVLSPDELGTTAAGAERALGGMLDRLDPVPPPTGEPPVPDEPDLWSKVSSRASAAWHSAATARASAAPAARPNGATAHHARPQLAHPSAAERAERFLATRAAHRTRRDRGPGAAESPLLGVAVGLMLFLVLIVAVLYIASNGG
jgi:hypothetical protein